MFQELADHIWFVGGKNNGRYPYANALFLDAEKKLLIDTGVGRSVNKKLIRQFGQPDIILYSHAHEDHIYDTDLFTATRYIHPNDRLMALSMEELFRQYGMNTPELHRILEGFLKSFHYHPLAEVSTFIDGEVFDLGAVQVRVLHCPGHSAGHCCFELPSDGLIFVADIDLTSFGPWYGALDSSIDEFKESIQKLLQKSPQTLISSHKGIIKDNIPELLERFLHKITERNERILSFLETPHNLEQIVPHALVHGKFYEPIEYYVAAERIMLEKHLTLLIAQKQLEFSDGQYQII
jgi:glyoxylase-like metal-dependent hydrolase (beta-lactamase superfamily II)